MDKVQKAAVALIKPKANSEHIGLLNIEAKTTKPGPPITRGKNYGEDPRETVGRYNGAVDDNDWVANQQKLIKAASKRMRTR